METKKNLEKYHSAEDCPITATIDVIGGKWKPPVIWLLMKGPVRFGEFSRIMPGIALKVLSRCLKELEADGIIIRKAYPEIPPRVEYSLSEKGESLREVMFLLSDWSRKNIMNQSESASL
jgi:DNA-binding HxlR family transcriptional regulator